jgi:hypothetical protein
MRVRLATIYLKGSPGLSLCPADLTCPLKDDELVDEDDFEEGVELKEWIW